VNSLVANRLETKTLAPINGAFFLMFEVLPATKCGDYPLAQGVIAARRASGESYRRPKVGARAEAWLIALELINIEVTAGVDRRFREGEIGQAEVGQGLRDWSFMIEHALIEFVPHGKDYDIAVDVSLQLKHPFQDCLYLALAQRMGAPLITTDPTFLWRTAGFATELRPLLQSVKPS
jgi:predicted nucleic acid-binding protein